MMNVPNGQWWKGFAIITHGMAKEWKNKNCGGLSGLYKGV